MSSRDKLVKELYRALYRTASRFDRESQAKTLIYRGISRDKMTFEGPTSSMYYSQIIDQLLSQRRMYLPTSSMKFKDIVNTNFRKPNQDFAIDDQIDAGFALYRKFTAIWENYTSFSSVLFSSLNGSKKETTEKRGNDTLANGPKSKKKETLRQKEPFLPFEEAVSPAPGLVLISHPLINGPLHRTVILILEHTESGSYGIVVNRPTSHTLKSAVKNLPREVAARFGDCPVNFGGMVRRMQLVHSIPNCGGLLIPYCDRPLYAGGLITKAISHANKFPSDLNRFQFFVGCCCWEPGQLEEELLSGYWILAKSKPDSILRLANNKFDPLSPNKDKGIELAAPVGDDNKLEVEEERIVESSDQEQGFPSSRGRASRKYRKGRMVENKVNIYSHLLRGMGEKYANLLSVPHWVDSTMIESCDWL